MWAKEIRTKSATSRRQPYKIRHVTPDNYCNTIPIDYAHITALK
jgi:hypothetical protein